MTALNKKAHQVQRYTNYGVDMMEWDDGKYVKYSDYLALLDEVDAAQKLATQQGNIAVALLDEVTTLRRNANDNVPELRECLEAAERRIEELSASLKDLIGVVNTVNRSRHHEIKMDDDDDPCYWQRKEWIEYLMETVSAAEGVYRAAGIGVKGE